jgi:hypothetical protein
LDVDSYPTDYAGDISMRKFCQAHVKSTGTSCQKKALVGSRYCYLHHSWGSTAVGSTILLTIGALLSPIAQSGWDKTFPKKETAPNLRLYVDRIPVSDGTRVILPTSNDVREVSFTLINLGDGEAENVELAVCFPSLLHVTKSDGWVAGFGIRSIEGTIQDGDGTCYWTRADSPINSSNILTFLPLTVQHPTLSKTDNGLSVIISCKKISNTHMTVWLKFTNGIEKPYLEKAASR